MDKKTLNVDFKGREIVLKQMLGSKVFCEYGYDYFSLKFIVNDTEKYPYEVRVPIEMRAFQRDSSPILFLIHIVEGRVDELEILTADSSKLILGNIELNSVEYVINDEVKYY